jgi:putative ABC transport system substrate-binding protein
MLCITAANAADQKAKVYITQVVEHRALDSTTKGIVDGLAQEGFNSGKNLELKIESAQGSAALAAQIASKYVHQNPDVVVGVGTIAAQSFAKYAQQDKAKLVFSSVTDPIGAGLVKKLSNPGNNTTGVSNFVALEPQLKLFLKLQPLMNKLGVIYNPGEANSVHIVKQLQKICPELGIKLVIQTVNRSSEVAQAATKLSKQVDAFFISNDNTLLSALQSVIVAANRAQIPVYVSDTDAVELGALAALGPNQYSIGVQTGKMIAKILRGEDPNQMPVEFPQKTETYINPASAQMLSIVIPTNLEYKS